MWTVVYMTPNEEQANRLIDVLRGSSILSRVRTAGSGCGCYEVLVPQTELESAQNLIFENDLL